jgi:hypothetical protein
MAAHRFLFFAPFGNWIVHTQLDCVIAAALANRGAEIKILGCDSQFKECLAAGTPPTEETCAACHQTSQEWFQRFQIPTAWLGSLLTPQDHQDAEIWAGTVDLRVDDAPFFDGQPIAHWVKLAVFSAIRSSRIPAPESPAYARPRQILIHGALIARATARILAEYKPDAVVCYSGSNGYYRIFVELARLAGCRVLVHERGSREGTFQLVPNCPTYEMIGKVHPGWEEWRKAPLTVAQLEEIVGSYDDRVQGKNTNFQAIHRYQSAPVHTRDRLRLPRNGRPVVLATCSGDWEFGMVCAFGGIHVLWKSQLAWLEHTAAICKKRGWQLIIRQHPLGAGKPTYPRATAWLSELLQEQHWMDEHVRVIMPGENTSTYDLFEIADVVVAQASRTPAEALARGVPAICVTNNGLELMGLPVVMKIEDLEATMEQAIARSPCVSVDDLRAAYRYAYFRASVVAKWDFTSVRIKEVYKPEFTLAGPEALLPGVDPALDRVCEHLLHSGPLYPSPSPAPAPEAEETAYIEERRQALLERRLAIRSAPQHSYPGVGILTTAKSATWRSRHQELTFHLQDLPSATDPAAMLKALGQLASKVGQPYLAILPPNVRYDECVIARAIDELEKPENASKQGTLFGCYVLEPDGTIGPEWNTPVQPIRPDELPPGAIDALHQPAVLLSLAVWRTDFFVQWTLSQADTIKSVDQAAAALLRSLTDSTKFVIIDEPSVYILSSPSREELLSESESTSADDPAAINAMKVRYEALYGATSAIGHATGEKLLSGKHYEPALQSALAVYSARQAGPETWRLLSRSMPEALCRRSFTGQAETASSGSTRFLQIHTFYSAYLSQHYAAKPHLLDGTHQQQVEALLADGFGVAHMWAPLLKEQGYDSRLVIANDVVSQFSWVKENLQSLRLKKKSEWLQEIVLEQVNRFQPDILHLGDTVAFDMRFVRRLKKRPKYVIGWRAAPTPDTVDWMGMDLLLSHLDSGLKFAWEHGVQDARRFYPGFSKWVADAVASESKEYDLVFVGQWSPDHERRNKLISKIAKAALGSERPFSFGLFLECADPSKMPDAVRKLNRGARWGMEMYRAVKRGRIALNAEIDMARGSAGNMRFFEATGLGVCLLTEHHDNISSYFQPGKELVTFKGLSDCLTQLYALLDNPLKVDEVASLGQRQCLTRHESHVRMEALQQILKSKPSFIKKALRAWLKPISD